MKAILRHLSKKDWGLIIFTIILVASSVWFDLKLPDYMSNITVLVQNQSEIAQIIPAGIKMLLCALGSLVVNVIVIICSAKIASNYSFTVRSLFYNSVQSFSMNEINKFSTPSLITRSTNDVTQVQNILSFGLHAFVKAPIMATWAIIKIATKEWQWTLSTALVVIFVCIVLMICYFFALPRFKKIQKLTDNINRITRENLSGLRVIRAYNAEKFQKNKFEEANDALTVNNLTAHRIMSILGPSMMLAMNGIAVIVYWVGAVIISATGDQATRIVLFSDMVVFSAYAIQVIMSFMMLNMIFIMAPRSMVAAKRINEVIDTKPVITDGKTDNPDTDIKGTVEFKNVSFRYPDGGGNVIENISFKVNKGETLAIIGSTGCGKSTLIYLIPRFYDATEGEILIDGINVKDYTLYSLHNKIGYIPQKAALFSGTVNTNVAFGDNGGDGYTESDVRKAVDTAMATQFVLEKEGQFEAHIAQGGSNVSGGQKQRLSIARAVCRNPEILIFDDSFSALDYKTDRDLRMNLKKENKGITNIIVAQRIGTIKDADMILVLDQGKLVGKGKHKELLKTCDVYKEIALSQLSEEELAQ